MTKPAGNLPTWNTGLANNTEPNGAKKTLGWEVNEKPASSYFNWWQNKVGEWVSYLDAITAEALTWTGLQTFDRKVTITPGASAGTNELGVQIQGKGTGYGMTVQGGVSQVIAIQSAGTIQLAEDAPSTKTTALVNEVAHRNIIKAHGYITTDGEGAVTYQDGASVTSVTLPGARVIRVTFAQAFSNDNYTFTVTAQEPLLNTPLVVDYLFKTTTTCEFRFVISTSGANFDPATDDIHVDFIAVGVQ